MKRAAVLFFACLALVLTVAAAAAQTQRTSDCTWGASSVVAEQVDGKLVQSEPATTGCIL
jgi:hypothetical protein